MVACPGVAALPWVQSLASEPGVERAVSSATFREHHLFSGKHLFAALLRNGLVQDIAGWYQPARQRFTTVVQVGPESSGYPNIVHGGASLVVSMSCGVDAAWHDGVFFEVILNHSDV